MRYNVIVPVFNEASCLEHSVERLMAALSEVPGGCRVYLVDDGSTDSSPELMRRLKQRYPDTLRTLNNGYGKGKGGAVRSALDLIDEGLVGIHDADLEYSPADLVRMFNIAGAGESRLILGSRFLSNNRFLRFQRLQNWLLSRFASWFFPESFTDIASCYKVFDARLVQQHPFRFSGFGFDCELAVLLLKRSSCLVEIPISFTPRDVLAGKKLKPWHGLSAVFAFLVSYWSIWFCSEIDVNEIKSSET